jgi:adenine-specific DNA-methyltransferase
MTADRYRGRLELTWTNKDQRLLASEDGSYVWVSPADYRVSEIRLLHSARAVGQVSADRTRARDNLLVRGDALYALTSMIKLPEFACEYVGRVKLAYLDPPFNTQQSFLQYDDALEHSVWLTMMRDRMLSIKSLLAPDGSVWVHCDDSEQAYLKVMMDEVFGRDAFVATVVWEKSYTRENRTDISTSHDYILAYALDRRRWGASRNLLPATNEQVGRYINPDNDTRGPWKALPAHAKAGPGRRAAQFYPITLPSGRVVNPPPGNCWRYTADRFQDMVVDGRIWFGRDGDGTPAIKRFLSEVPSGLVPITIWPHDEVGTTGTAKMEILEIFPGVPPFSTPKPEALIARIVHIASKEGDIVLDCFVGSGTTAAVAHKMGRRWVGIDINAETVYNYAIPRLTKVVEGSDRGGISETLGWDGGGGFRVLEVASSMFEADQGLVVLAERMINGTLAEATAAQLGFAYEPDPPFSGRKGRTRLAVVDGVVNEAVVRLIASALNEGLVWTPTHGRFSANYGLDRHSEKFPARCSMSTGPRVSSDSS